MVRQAGGRISKRSQKVGLGADTETWSILVSLLLPGYGVSSCFCHEFLLRCTFGPSTGPKTMGPSGDALKTTNPTDNIHISSF
jgi:hypothetical protein